MLYWISVSFLTPFIVLVGLFNGRRQLLHDMVLGTVIINSSVPMPVVQTSRPDRTGSNRAGHQAS